MGRPINSRYFSADDAQIATMTITVTGGTVDSVALVDGGFGYTPSLTGETFLLATSAGGGDGLAEITYDTTAGGVVTNPSVSAAGTTYDNGAGQSITDVPTPTAGTGTFQILGSAFLPNGTAGAAEAVYIVRQRSNQKFEVQSVANDPGGAGDRDVVTTANTGTPTSGQLSIPVEPSDGAGGSTGTEYAKIITGRKLRTFDGNSYIWGSLTNDDVGEGLPGGDQD